MCFFYEATEKVCCQFKFVWYAFIRLILRSYSRSFALTVLASWVIKNATSLTELLFLRAEVCQW